MDYKKLNHKISIKAESKNCDNEYTEKDLPPWYEDMLYQEWRDRQAPMKDHKDNR
jgi:Sec7-like guanine-nucleotide exchange factor